MDAMAQGYKVHVVADAASSRAEENHRLALETMRQFGAVITSTESVLYEIMERKDIKEFKEVLPLLK